MVASKMMKATSVLSAVVVAGLVVLAVPAFEPIAAAAVFASNEVTNLASLKNEPLPTEVLNERDRCNPGQGSKIRMVDPIAGGRLDPDVFADMRDLGPREFAVGDVTFNEAGIPALYTVAPGDAELAIVARLCLTSLELNELNFVRFCLGETIQPGDVYNLDPYTVATAGGRLSGICDNRPTFTLP